MNNRLQIVNILKHHKGARILVVSSFFFKARDMFKHVSGVIRNERMRGYKMDTKNFVITGPDDCEIRFVIAGRSVLECEREWAGLQCTNVIYDRDLGLSLDDLLPFLLRLMRSPTYKGPFTMEPLLKR